MSWSVTVERAGRDDVVGALVDEFQRQYPTPAAGVHEQFERALDAVGAVVVQVEPDGDKQVRANIAGHSAAAGGYPYNSITISVSQAAA